MNKTPIYKHSGTYAKEHDELKKYFASHNTNLVVRQVDFTMRTGKFMPEF